MAEPISKVAEPILTEDEIQNQALEKVLEDITKNIDGIQETIKLLQELHDSGILEGVTSLIEAKEQIAKIVVEQSLRPPVTNAINNAMAAAGMITEINPETTKKMTESLTKGIQKAEEGLQLNKKVGLFDLLKLIKDPDINRVLRFGMDFLKGLGEGLKEKA
ncbi:helical membrane plugin domain-containing protein [Cytobacillus kochii]